MQRFPLFHSYCWKLMSFLKIDRSAYRFISLSIPQKIDFYFIDFPLLFLSFKFYFFLFTLGFTCSFSSFFSKVLTKTVNFLLSTALGAFHKFRCVVFSFSFTSVQSLSRVWPSLWPHQLQHVRLPSLSPTPGACSNSCVSYWWCHPTISSSVVPFSSCLQCFPASGSFPVGQFFTSGGHSIGTSASVLPMNIQNWFPLGLTGLILQSKTQESSLKSHLQHLSSKAPILQCSPFFMVQLIHDYWKNHSFEYTDPCRQSYVFAF